MGVYITGALYVPERFVLPTFIQQGFVGYSRILSRAVAELYIICIINSNWISYQKDKRTKCAHRFSSLTNSLFYSLKFCGMGRQRRISKAKNMEWFNANLCGWSSFLC